MKRSEIESILESLLESILDSIPCLQVDRIKLQVGPYYDLVQKWIMKKIFIRVDGFPQESNIVKVF